MSTRILLTGHRLLLMVLLFAPVTLWAEESRLALVIGNSNYEDSPLANPQNDANDMAEVLEDLGFTVILRTDADRRGMARAIRDFGRQLKEKRGVGLFYYAGHGMQLNNRNFLIPVDTAIEEEDEVPFDSIDVGSVLAKMESAGNSLNMLILDACRNNPFQSRFRSGNRGLARVEAPVGSLVVYATAPGDIAADGEGRNGVFTGALLKQLRTDGLSLTQTIRRTRAAVVKATGGQQVPWETSSLLQDYYFGSSPLAVGPTNSALTSPTPVETAVETAIANTPVAVEPETPAAIATAPTTDQSANPSGAAIENLAMLSPDATSPTTRISQPSQSDAPMGRLTISVEPPDARVRIMNIVEKYTPGIELAMSRSYDVYVTKPGYKSFRKKINLAEPDQSVAVILSQKDPFADAVTQRDPEKEKPAIVKPSNTAGLPATIALAGGLFEMGCSKGDSQCESYEKPTHRVNVRPFEMTRTEITVGQFALFVYSTGYKTDAEKNADGKNGCYVWTEGGGISRSSARWKWSANHTWKNPGYQQDDNFPVTCVSWNDAKAYARWLSQSSGKQFSLPSEAEWEFAARAGTTARYGSVNSARGLCAQSNIADRTLSPSGSKWSDRVSCTDNFWFSAPVSSFQPNSLGLHDMQGNVWEWVEDTWASGFKDTRRDGIAFTGGNQEERVLRGGAWDGDETRARLSSRSKGGATSRAAMTGFRLVVRN